MSGDATTDDPKPDHADVCMLWLGSKRGRLHGSAVQRSDCREKWFHAIEKFWAPLRSRERAPGARQIYSLLPGFLSAPVGAACFSISSHVSLQPEFGEI